ncbi:S8 family serine peptidase [Sorangium sp. So ce136]|uniref:S8 family peptidase n=1 Tax=Sorangium sp. So ce136 TaxID=3133284 RepID=UPI003F05A68E
MKLWGISVWALSMALAGCVDELIDDEETMESRQALLELQQLKLDVRSGPGAKLGPHLLALQRAVATHPHAGDAEIQRKFPMLSVQDGYVRVSAYGDDGVALATQLSARGMLDANVHGRAVSGRVPISSLLDIATTRGLASVQPTMAISNAGLVTTQGDRSLRSDVARARFRVDGRGVRVGVLSISFDCAPGPLVPGQMFTDAADDIASDDLPSDIRVLKDLHDEPNEDCTDEGRAMMQIIHDVAPGAGLSFYTAAVSVEDFADGIVALAEDGADVIVDDVIYFAEPMFEDGIVADAVDEVVNRGVAYFSSAGNAERHSYQSKFRNSGRRGASGGRRHDFQPGAGVDDLQRVSVSAGATTVVAFNWDQPSISANGVRGSRSDMDVIFYDVNGEPLEECMMDVAQDVCQLAGVVDNIGGDAVEVAAIVNESDEALDLKIGLELVAGPAPGLMKYVWFDLAGTFIVEEFDTRSSTIYGHSNAAGAEAVGAAAWFDTEEWGSPLEPACVPACLESFSSAGGTPVLFGERGERLSFPHVRLKPGVTGPDGGNTTFFVADLTTPIPGTTEPDGFPNFFGTSASAPHVAAVAALMLDRREHLSPSRIYGALRLTADDMRLRNFGGEIGPQPVPGAAGFDFDTGFGFVDAARAVRAISHF